MTVSQLKALRAAALLAVAPNEYLAHGQLIDGQLARFMEREAGRNWHSNLRKATAAVSGELADAIFKQSMRRK